jgi:hypothetical protein
MFWPGVASDDVYDVAWATSWQTQQVLGERSPAPRSKVNAQIEG